MKWPSDTDKLVGIGQDILHMKPLALLFIIVVPEHFRPNAVDLVVRRCREDVD